jgi:hypothetical protein
VSDKREQNYGLASEGRPSSGTARVAVTNDPPQTMFLEGPVGWSQMGDDADPRTTIDGCSAGEFLEQIDEDWLRKLADDREPQWVRITFERIPPRPPQWSVEQAAEYALGVLRKHFDDPVTRETYLNCARHQLDEALRATTEPNPEDSA